MARFKSIILITAIGMLVLFSGCAGTQEKNTADKTQETPASQVPAEKTPAGQTPAAQTPVGQVSPFELQVTEAKTFDDCINQNGQKKSCFLINLEAKNNKETSADIKIVKDVIIYKAGNEADPRYDTDVGLNDLCVRTAGLQFKLEARKSQLIGMCYPLIKMSDKPTYKIEIMVSGDRKEYTFDLTK
ncbi:MAG TPA: hypothetical protein VIO58_09115 [Candidatus Methanoperedens sp.]